jgi:hypothetical protein
MGDHRNDHDDDDRYFDLEGLAAYSGFSTRTLKRYLDDPERPLPSYHVHPTGKDRGKLLVSKREFDAWVRSFGKREPRQPKPKDRTPMDERVARALRSFDGG